MLRLSIVVLLSAVSLAAYAQPAPAIDYGRLLDTPFYTNQGTFGFGDGKSDFLLFPPSISDAYDVEGAYIVRNSEGRVVGRQAIGRVQLTGSDAIVTLRKQGYHEWPGPLDAGDHTLEVEFEGHSLVSFPFSVSVAEGGDPFDPKTTWTLDGPWRTHAYFSHETARPDYQLHFSAWIAPDDMPSNTPSEVSIRRDGVEVAFGFDHSNLRYGWGRSEYQLHKAEGRHEEFARRVANAPNWTIEDVTPGTYEIVLSSESGPFRTFSIEAEAGAFVAHPYSDVSTDRTRFLTPRRLSGQNLNKPHTLYWTGDGRTVE